MKILPQYISCLLGAAFTCAQIYAEEVGTPSADTTADAPASSSSEDESSKPGARPHFQIESTQVKLIEVAEAPPMQGLPPVEGTMTLTVHSVADPHLPEKPQLSIADNGEGFVDETPDLTASQAETLIASVSATVFDHSRTLLTCQVTGGNNKAVSAWSNLDFNHFSGVATFDAAEGGETSRSYFLLMGIGNDNTADLAGIAASEGIKYQAPDIPGLADGAPAFVILTENPDAESARLIEDLHAHYETNRAQMAKDAAAREKVYEEKKAYLLANPPKPKDVTVHFWKREKSAPPAEGGQP